MLDSIAALVMVMLNELEETDLVLDLVCLHNLLGAFLPPDVKTMGYQIQRRTQRNNWLCAQYNFLDLCHYCVDSD